MESVHQQKDLESDKENVQVETDKQLKWIDNNPLKTEKTGKHTCEVCRNPFLTKQGLKNHLINIHKYNTIQARKGANISGKQNYKENSDESDFFCVPCDMAFHDRISWKRHDNLGFHAKSKESLKMNSSQNLGVEKPDKNERIGPFPCKLCSTKFATKAIFDEHILSVHLETELKCHLCHKSFQLERKLKSHMKIVHEFLNEDGQEELQIEAESNSVNNSYSTNAESHRSPGFQHLINELNNEMEGTVISIENTLRMNVLKKHSFKHKTQCNAEDKVSNFIEFHQYKTKVASLAERYNNLMEFGKLDHKNNSRSFENSFVKKEMIVTNEIEETHQKKSCEVFPYQQINLNEILNAPQKIAEKLIEGFNYPGLTEPMPVDSSSLPKGWHKSVIRQKGIIKEGKWEIRISPSGSDGEKYFVNKEELENYLKRHKSPLNVDMFDFDLDGQLRNLYRIWKKYLFCPSVESEAFVKGDIITEDCEEEETQNDISDIYPYLRIDLSQAPEKIASELMEGFNYPGTVKPMPIDSSSLPEGWQKSVIQRIGGTTEGKWEVCIRHAEVDSWQYFKERRKLEDYLKTNNFPQTADMFDFRLDNHLKKLKEIWKNYIYQTPVKINKGHYLNEAKHSGYLDVENYPVYSPSKYPLIKCSVTLPKLEYMPGNFKVKKQIDFCTKEQKFENFKKDDKISIEFGDKYPYLQIDLSGDAENIAQAMVEDYNYPGTSKPMPVDSSSLPEGWQKSVIRRRGGVAEGRLEVLIRHSMNTKSCAYFRKKTEIETYLKRNKLPYTIDMFDFCLDEQLKKLRQIWAKYIFRKPIYNAKNGRTSLKEHVKMNPIPPVKQEIFSPNKKSKTTINKKMTKLKDHVKENPIPLLKKELISPKKKTDDISTDQNMLQLKNLGVYDNYIQLANENEENNEYMNVDPEITPNKSKKRAVEKSDSDSGIDEAKRLKTEKMWDEMMFNDNWNQDDSNLADTNVSETKISKVHSCPHCDYTSKFINNLGRHIRKRHGSSATLKVKIKSEPKSNAEATLNQKKNQVNSSENYKPIIEKSSKIYSCPHCDFTSKYNSNVGHHIRKRHGSGETLKVKIKSGPKSKAEGTLNQNENQVNSNVKSRPIVLKSKLPIHACHLCDYKAKPGSMSIHLKSKHGVDYVDQIIQSWKPKTDFEDLKKGPMKISRKAEQKSWKLAEGNESLPYLEIDLNQKAKLIAKQLCEGVNIPSTQNPMPVNSENLPESWKKYVIQMKKPNAKSKWNVLFSHNKTGKWITAKTLLVRYLAKQDREQFEVEVNEDEVAHKVKLFDFSMPNKLRKLINIWKRYQKPESNPEGFEEEKPLKLGKKPMKLGRKALQKDWELARENEPLPYIEIDLKEKAKTIVKKLVEGVNIPGTQKPMPVDSSSLPEGWKKYVIQKKLPNEKSKWSVFFSHETTRKWFSCKNTLIPYLEKENLLSNIKTESFEFTVPKQLRKIISIWRHYQVRNTKRKLKKPLKRKESVSSNANYILNEPIGYNSLKDKMTEAKEFLEKNELLPYLQIDMAADPEEIADKLTEGVNFPGLHKPMFIDNSGLPEGWQKSAVLRKPQKEGSLRFEILVSHPEITKGINFNGKPALQKFFDKKQIPMSADGFDFHNDPKIQKLGQIWKAYRMSPTLKVPKSVKESISINKNEKSIVDTQTLPIDPATVKIEHGIHDNSDNWSELSLEEEVLNLEEESSLLNESITLPDDDLNLLDYSMTVDEHSLEDGEPGSLKQSMALEENENLIAEDIVVSFYNFE